LHARDRPARIPDGILIFTYAAAVVNPEIVRTRSVPTLASSRVGTDARPTADGSADSCASMARMAAF